MCWFFSRGRPRPVLLPQAAAALGSAEERLEQQLETYTTGQAAVLLRRGLNQTGQESKAELEALLIAAEPMRGLDYRLEVDDTDHPWVIIRAASLVELASAARFTADALDLSGVGDRTMAAVFPFTWRGQRIYWLYQTRARGFTPFVPTGKPEDEQRDHQLEVRMATAMEKTIPVAKDISQWYPVWGMPV